MALNATTIETAVKATVKSELEAQFPDGSPPIDGWAASMDKLATIIAKVVVDIIAAMKNDADLTGVSSGGDTVLGGID